jgi:hypothetical protein
MWTKSKVSFIEPYVFNSPLIKAVSVPLNPTIHPLIAPARQTPVFYMQGKKYKYRWYFSATNCLFLARFTWDSYRDNNNGGHMIFLATGMVDL